VSYSQEVVLPRNGHTLITGVVARISGCANQKELSLEDQVDHAKEEVAELYQGPSEYRVVATKGKGEQLDRPELAEIEAMLRSRELDLLVMEDIGRLIRGAEASRLWGIAVDHGIRCIAPNDCCDTADGNWEQDLLEACAEHVGHNAQTSKRLKKKLMNRFKKYGAITPCPTSGYIKPEGAKTFDDWRKDDTATPIIQEGARRLKETLNCSAVADWFNRQGLPVGKYCGRRGRKIKKWTGAMVRRYYRNTMLKGRPCRGTRHTVKRHEKGRRVSEKNPKGPIYRECPHLAHLDPILFDELNALLTAKNDKYHRKLVNGIDPLWQVSRKRTVFPGQHACCWYCGWHFVWGGNGVTENLMCSNSRQCHCWNSFGFNGTLAAERLVSAITAELYQLHGFEAQFTDMVRLAQRGRSGNTADDWRQLLSDEAKLATEKENFNNAIKMFGARSMLLEQINNIETRERDLARRRHLLEHLRTKNLELPESIGELRQQLEDNFSRLATDSPEFGDLMRQLVPDFYVYLVRLVDGGHPLPRARVKLTLAGIVPDAQAVPKLEELLTRELTLDLFERPPQREQIRKDAVRLDAQHIPHRQIAAQLPEENPKLKVVQDALALDRKMKELGLESPYVLVTEPPEDYPKLRRHKNSQYKFRPREGYQRPAI
jgi:site-specific DNA recombinase